MKKWLDSATTNLFTEDTQSELLEMGDRVDELEAEIEKLWKRLGNLPDDKDEIVLQLISRYVELEGLEPGRVDFEESSDDKDKEDKPAPKDEKPQQSQV